MPHRGTGQRGHSLSQKRMAPLEPQEKGFALADWHLKSCAACGIRCLPGVVSKRLGLLLSSLSLCLRFGSLTQFPPTLDLYRFAIACRGGFAGARRSTHYQDDMHCQMIRLHQNKMSRAAADDRSRPNRIAMLTRLRRAQAVAFQRPKAPSSLRLPILTPFFWTGDARFLSRERKWGAHSCSACGAAFPAPAGRVPPLRGIKKRASLRDTPFYHPNRVWSKGFLLPFRALRAL